MTAATTRKVDGSARHGGRVLQ